MCCVDSGFTFVHIELGIAICTSKDKPRPNDTINNELMKHFRGTDLIRPILSIYAP